MTKRDFLVAYNIGHRDGRTDAYCPNDYDDIFDIEQQSSQDCCNGNQEEKAKLCQKSYIAGMEHNCENEQIIKVRKGTLKARTGRYVVYDVEWLKKHFNTTEAKIYGQPNEDYISRKAVLDSLHSCFAEGFNEDRWWNSTHVLDAINEAPSIQPQPKEVVMEIMETYKKSKTDTAKWVIAGAGIDCTGHRFKEYKCSHCGNIDNSHRKNKFCPECGRRMEG